MYEHRYKYGKQKAIMSVEEFKEKLEAANIRLEQKAFLVYCGTLERAKAKPTNESKKTSK
jgi:hypothetical protein